ncbi:putative hydro-lyase [Pokkaliibacter sp. MBI-7]|uniref:putative hydro-lyase n=1 Tax=Pokkaliibacter sp. MBI-7 TaxID=3040600 RepID=UPI00244A1234|nr:putative hydro-lyase [Pokkaliibacter sp. MBI-7]MDH2434476.1 putative hydro-lyase [Pokkaliibacter sp. MBI-7]
MSHLNDSAAAPAALLSSQQLRQRCRSGEHQITTSGYALGYAQANLVILPQQYASDFLRFCQLNQKACPLLYVSEPGQTDAPPLGRDIDIRRDTPRYRLYEQGECRRELTDISELWRDDLVTFYIGCSFSFEEELISAGVPVRHIDHQRNVPMYLTNRPLQGAGPFQGNMVVSMRGFSPANAIRAVQITSQMPKVHGAPVHLSAPEQLGIANLQQPEFGDAPVLEDGDIPVFWACGVSPQAALMNARLPFAITHSPGHMLVTDLPNSQLRFG